MIVLVGANKYMLISISILLVLLQWKLLSNIYCILSIKDPAISVKYDYVTRLRSIIEEFKTWTFPECKKLKHDATLTGLA